MRLLSSHNLPLTIILGLMIVLFILKITIFEILTLIFCNKRTNKYKNITRGTEKDSILEGNLNIF